MFAANTITTFLFSCLYPGTVNPHKYHIIKINNASAPIRRLDEFLLCNVGECNGGVIYPAILDDAPLFLSNMSTRRLVSKFILNLRSGDSSRRSLRNPGQQTKLKFGTMERMDGEPETARGFNRESYNLVLASKPAKH